MSTTTLPFHPLAGIFPLMEGAEFDALVADIKANGLLEPIVTYEGMILDGRTRYRACLAAGWTPLRISHQILTGGKEGEGDLLIDNPAAYVISTNIHRRHLTPAQKRELIAKLIKTQPKKSNRQHAKAAGVSHTHVAKVRAEMEKSGDVATVATSIDTKGRKQPAKKPKARNNGENADDPETSAETMKAEFAASDGKAAAPSEAEPDDGSPFVANPAEAAKNLRLQFDGQRSVAEACRKIITVVRLEDGARKELKVALGRLIRKWKVVLNTLEYEVPTGGGHE
jgi:ParB-like nuclease domain